MSTLRIGQARTSLEPLRATLLQRAQAEADRLRAQAQAEAGEAISRAEEQAAEILAQARTRGEAQAAAELSALRSHHQHERRGEILATEQDAYRELLHTATTAVCALRADPGYPALRDSLRDTAVRLLGAEAALVEDPAGGIIATADGRRLDLSLPAIASRALQEIEPEIEGLWA